MPSDSKVLTILENFKSTIAAITSGASYFFTWSGGAKLAKGIPADISKASQLWPLALIIPGDDQVTNRDLAGSRNLLDREITIEVLAVNHAGADRDEETQVEHSVQLAADVMKALMVDITRGGAAVDTVLESSMLFPDEIKQADSSVGLRFRCRYQHFDNDPSSSG